MGNSQSPPKLGEMMVRLRTLVVEILSHSVVNQMTIMLANR